jgi:hypothetical protein
MIATAAVLIFIAVFWSSTPPNPPTEGPRMPSQDWEW